MNEETEPRGGLDGEAQHHAAFLDWLREEVIAGVESLPADQLRVTRLSSGWTPIELLSHVLHMERRWFLSAFLGERIDAVWGDWDTEDPWDGPEAAEPRWHVDASVTAEELVRRLREVGARTREVLASHPLDRRADPAVFEAGQVPDLRWICFHVLAEYARHAGHLDIAVELARAES